VSYLGRVARRAAGARGPSGLTPTGASGSPLARYDQRLNLPGASGLPGVGRARGDEGGPAGTGADDIGLDDATTSGTALAPPATPSAGSESARVAPPREQTSPGRATNRPGAREPGDEATPSRRRADAAASSDAHPVRRGAEPGGVPDAGSRAPGERRTARTRDVPGAAVDDDGAAPARRPSRSGPLDPLAEALAKVSRWMATPPREPAPAGRDGRDGRDGRPGPDRSARTAGDAVRGDGLAGGARGVRARMAAIERATTAVPAAPRLRIGRIDVQVVTPQPAPAPAPIARPGRGARPTPAAPEATPASYLTFGLRQT
jgi:hypothetical protein